MIGALKVKGYEYTFKVENSKKIVFASLLKSGQTVKEKNLLPLIANSFILE